MLLVTPVHFLLRQVKMSAVKKAICRIVLPLCNVKIYKHGRPGLCTVAL